MVYEFVPLLYARFEILKDLYEEAKREQSEWWKKWMLAHSEHNAKNLNVAIWSVLW